jgi:hypothetical protein
MTGCSNTRSGFAAKKGEHMGKKYELLRLAFKTRGYTLETVGKYILDGRVKSIVADKLSGRIKWTMDDAHAIIKALRVPQEWMPLLFPPNGIAVVTDEQREMIRFGRAA